MGDTVAQLQRKAVMTIVQALYDEDAKDTNRLGLILATVQRDPDYCQSGDVRRILNATNRGRRI